MSNVSFEKVEADTVSAISNTLEEQTQIQLPTVAIDSKSDTIVTDGPKSQHVTQPLINAPLSNFLQRPVRIFEQDLGPTDAQAVNWTFNPWALWAAVPAVQEKLENFKVLRGTLRLTAMFTFPGNCFGSYVVTALPFTYQEVGMYTGSAGLHWPNVCQTDRYARVDCAGSENVQMDLPWFCQTDYLRVSNLATTPMWNVSISALSPVKTAITGGTAYGHVTIYANIIEDFVMTVPRYQLKFSTGAHAVSEVASWFSWVPIVGPFAMAASGIARGVGDIAEMLGYTRKNVEPPKTGSFYSISNNATVDSDVPALMAGLSVANAISIDPLFHAENDEDVASFTSLFARWTLVHKTEWDPAYETGDNITTFPISPFFTDLTPGTAWHLTTAGYVGLPFQWWRGDMEYLIVIPVSKLHRGTIQLFWTSNSDDITSTTDPTNITPNMIHDVSAGSELHIGIGYTMAEPVQSCHLMETFGQPCNGKLTLRVVNPLRSQLGETQTPVDILVFARASPNMQFGMLTDQVDDISEAFPRNTCVRYQAGATGDEQPYQPTRRDLLPPTGEYPLAEVLMGESVRSVRALMQKPSLIPLLEFPSSGLVVPRGGPVRKFTGPWLHHGIAPSTPLPAHYRQMFAAVSGSERFSFIGNNANYSANRLFGGVYPNNGSRRRSNAIAPVSFSGPQRGVEFVVPNYKNLKFTPGTYNVNTTSYPDADGTILRQYCLADDPPNLFWCYGPDLRVANFAQVPQIVTNFSSPIWYDPVAALADFTIEPPE